MSSTSSIEWTDATWNPVRGCTKISPGCLNCYAETFAERFRGVPGHPYEQGFDLKLVPEKLADPLKWSRPRRIFVNSMSDLFHDGVPDEFIDRVFAVMAMASQHTFQVLTKRPERMQRYLSTLDRHNTLELAADAMFPDKGRPEFGGKHKLPRLPLRNVWLGTSIEDQRRADERIPHLLQTPAAVRFLSMEPLLGPVDLSKWLTCQLCGGTGELEEQHDYATEKVGCPCMGEKPLHWVIVGGESGHGARPMHPDWVRSVRDQCKAAAVPFFFKQWGEWLPHNQAQYRGAHYSVAIHKFDEDRLASRVGKKAAGRLLDGGTHDEFPGGTHDEFPEAS